MSRDTTLSWEKGPGVVEGHEVQQRTTLEVGPAGLCGVGANRPGWLLTFMLVG